MTVLEEYLTRQRHAINTALTGTGDSTDLLAILSTSGIRGIAQITHYALTYKHETMTEIAYADTGKYTTVSQSLCKNGTAMLIQTHSRLYMVSRHYMAGTALSRQDVRLVAPIKEECALLILTQHGRYQTIQGGTINCMEHTAAFSRFTLKEGNTIHIDETEHCNNVCIQIGSKGYMREDRHMHAQPTVHPADMKQFKRDRYRGDETAAGRKRAWMTDIRGSMARWYETYEAVRTLYKRSKTARTTR
jgi:hypothetical protein